MDILILFLFSIVLVIGSWTIGLIINLAILKQPFYERISHMNFIRSEAVNKAIGVGLVRWGAMNTFFRFFNPNIHLSNSAGVDRLTEIRKQMTHSEIGHLIAFVAVVVYSIFMAVNGRLLFAGMLTLSNFFLNLHPSLLQQQNKRRIDQVLQRYS